MSSNGVIPMVIHEEKVIQKYSHDVCAELLRFIGITLKYWNCIHISRNYR